MTTIRIASATPADAGAVTECIAAAYAKARETISDLPDVAGGVSQEIDDHHVILAWAGDRLGGVIVFDQQDAEMKVFNLAVAPQAQGQGIAGRLLAHAEAEAHRNHCTHLTLRTHRLMEDTRAIYSHLGWVETDVIGNTVTMEKKL